MPCTYTADIGQYDEPDIDERPRPRDASTAPRSPASSTRRRALVEEGLVALQCGAFHIRSGGKTYFNTTPLGRAVTGTMLVRAMKEDGVDIWGDGSTYKGNDIERFYRYGLLANPRLRIYKPWLDAAFVNELGGRTEMSEWLVARGFPYRDSTEKAYSHRRQHLGRHPRGQAPRGADRRARHRRADHGRRRLARRRRDRHRGRHRPLRGRPPGRASTASSSPTRSRSCSRPTPSAAATVSARPTRSRTASSRRRAAASTRPRAWRCCTSPTSACSTRSTTRTPSRNYHNEGRRLGRLMYEGRWLDPQSLMLRESLQRWVGSAVTGEVTLRLRRGDDYTILDTTGPALSYHPDKLSMERVGDAAFGPDDRIGQLTMRNLDIADSRSRLEQYAAAGLIGGADRRARRPARGGRGRARSSRATDARRRRRRARARDRPRLRGRRVRLRHRLSER